MTSRESCEFTGSHMERRRVRCVVWRAAHGVIHGIRYDIAHAPALPTGRAGMVTMDDARLCARPRPSQERAHVGALRLAPYAVAGGPCGNGAQPSIHFERVWWARIGNAARRPWESVWWGTQARRELGVLTLDL